MPSKHVPNQSILFTVSFNPTNIRWHLLGASGEFCLPYLRQQHENGHPVDLRAQINTVEDLRGAFYLWEGSVYIEFNDQDTWLTQHTRLEWSGVIRPASPPDVTRYLLPQHHDIGPIERSLPHSTET